MPAKGTTPALDPETAQKYRQVVQYRAAGLTFDEIAERVGYRSRSGAKEAYDAALRWWGREAVDDLRTIEGERLESLWRKVFTENGETPAPVTPETVRQLIECYPIGERFHDVYMVRQVQVMLEKKDSGPSPNGTSAAGPSIAAGAGTRTSDAVADNAAPMDTCATT